MFLFFKTTRMTLRPTQSPLQWVSVTHPPEVKQPEHKADHPLRSSAEVKTRVAAYHPPLHAFTSVHLDRTLSLSISLSPSVYQAHSRSVQIFHFAFLSFFLSLSLSYSLRIFFLPVFDLDSTVGAGTTPRAERPGESGDQNPAGVKILFNTTSRPALGFTGPLIQWGPKATSFGAKANGA
jgi:hypothetical protein